MRTMLGRNSRGAMLMAVCFVLFNMDESKTFY